jgi:predicted hydrocarbon binding protein
MYTDRLPKEKSVLMEIKEAARNNVYGLEVSPIHPLKDQNLTIYDKLLFSQITDKRLSDIQVLYPDRFEEMLEKIAIWETQGIVTLKPVEKSVPTEENLTLINRFALTFPTRMTIALLKILYSKKKMRTVPFDSYMAMKNSGAAFCRIFTPTEEARSHLNEVETFFHDLATRKTALEYVKAFGQNPQVKLDPKHIPKFCSLTLYQAYGLIPKVNPKTESTFEITLKDCLFCQGITSPEPVCNMISTSLTGVLSVIYKERFTCNEVECKAMGSEVCRFILKKYG